MGIELLSGIPIPLYFKGLKDYPKICEIVTRSKTKAEQAKDREYDMIKSQESVTNNLGIEWDSYESSDPYLYTEQDLTIEQLTEPEIKIQQRSDPDLKMLIDYLEQGKLPEGYDAQRALVLMSVHYSITNGILYHNAYSKNQGGVNAAHVFQLVIPKNFKKAVLF